MPGNHEIIFDLCPEEARQLIPANITLLEDCGIEYDGITFYAISSRMIQQMQCIISRDVVFDGTAKVAHMLINDLETFNALKKHEIAYMLHIQPETLSRILNKLTRNGVIEIDKNNVVILNTQELKDIYE